MPLGIFSNTSLMTRARWIPGISASSNSFESFDSSIVPELVSETTEVVKLV